MRRKRKRTELLLAVLVAAVVILIVLGAPQASLWLAKQEAWRKIASIPSRQKATLDNVLAPEVKQVPVVLIEGDSLAYALGAYEFLFPADEYARLADANDGGVESDRLEVRFLSLAPRSSDFSETAGAADASIRDWLRRTDPYDLLVEAFNATPTGIREQDSHAGLQKHLYLLLLKSVHQPIGSETLFLQFRAGGYKGFLAGDTTSDLVIVWIYLPDAQLFAELLISPKDRTEMADVYRCLGQLRIRRP